MRLFLTILFFIFSVTIQAKPITYKSAGAEYEGFILKKSTKAPTVFIIHDWDGLTEYEIKRSNMLNQMGYSVFAMDLFGKGVRPTKDADKRQHTGELYKDRKKMRNIMKAAIDTARKNGLNVNNAVIIGYCFGGAAVLELARSGENLKGFVTFHGGLSTPKEQNYKNTKGQVFVFHGTADKAITMNDFANLADELEANNIKHEMISYGGAPHAFTVFGAGNYRKDADKNSWARFNTFLKEITN